MSKKQRRPLKIYPSGVKPLKIGGITLKTGAQDQPSPKKRVRALKKALSASFEDRLLEFQQLIANTIQQFRVEITALADANNKLRSEFHLNVGALKEKIHQVAEQTRPHAVKAHHHQVIVNITATRDLLRDEVEEAIDYGLAKKCGDAYVEDGVAIVQLEDNPSR